MLSRDIELFMERQAACFETAQVNELISDYADNCLFWEACGIVLEGRNAIQEWAEALFAKCTLKRVRYEIISMMSSNIMACCHVIWNVEVLTDDEPLKESQIKVTYSFKKSDDGWKVWHIHGSC